MDRDTLRSVQRPLKQLYREQPAAGSIVLDVRGTLGLDPDAAVGFSSIKLSFELQTEASEQEVAQLIEATEKYCVVLQTLESPLDIEVAASVQ
ncbi:OsmC family protein [Glutamicibacter nicotianae]|uniref:OsmC family protein n=1 Tax=Glutamicibacter nicotianae TaxID=37929 RepID=UPI00167F43B8|nr:OsmC family protein [Glutamicibacter nicotianae]